MLPAVYLGTLDWPGMARFRLAGVWVRVLALAVCGWWMAAQAADPGVVAAAPTDVSTLIPVDPAKGEFSLIVIPDTQRYTAYFPYLLRLQFRWIRDAVAPLHAKYAVHLGDVVETGAESEWMLADEAFSLLDGVVPYTVVPGNHDIDPRQQKPRTHLATHFNAVFSPKRSEGQPWYGGHKGVTGDNSFGYFSAGGQSFMVLGLEFGPTDETLAWANTLVSNTESKVIVVTHNYMYDDNTRVGEGDLYHPHGLNETWNDGEQMWEKFIRRHDNIVMVLSGHIKGKGVGTLVSQTSGGSPVLQMLSNYQFMDHGGETWLRVLRFSPRDKVLDVFTYSPWLGKLREEDNQRFRIAVPWMFPSPPGPAPTPAPRATPAVRRP